jgi:hypothetical protein
MNLTTTLAVEALDTIAVITIQPMLFFCIGNLHAKNVYEINLRSLKMSQKPEKYKEIKHCEFGLQFSKCFYLLL